MAFDIEIGAATVYMEASNQGAAGQTAVAHTLVNRWRSGKFGKTLAAVCLQPLQFSSWNTKDPNRIRMATASEDDPTLIQCQRIMREAYAGVSGDPTNGACFYFDDSIPAPAWTENMTATVKIGKLNFFRS